MCWSRFARLWRRELAHRPSFAPNPEVMFSFDTVIDTAVAEYGVTFHFIDFEREEVRWKPPARKQRAHTAAEPA